MNEKVRARIGLIASMTIFGTIGIFRRYIPLSSSFIAMTRGIVGALFLFATMALLKKKLDRTVVRNNLAMLIISGASIGVNWILLFEAYNYTSVATATLCYYFAPIFTILLAAVFLKEKLTRKSIACVLIALIGMLFVSGFWQEGIKKTGEITGILLGLGAALLYASVVVINKKFASIPAFDRTTLQLLFAGVAILPYLIIKGELSNIEFSPFVIAMLAIVSIVHTGVAYTLYFSSLEHLPAKTLAIFSYIDPVVAVILSVTILREAMTIYTIIGAILIIGAAIYSEGS